jgi:hypothetical protein
MGLDQKPPYILLADKLPEGLSSKILGRIVSNPLFPTDEYVPDDPQDHLNAPPLEVTDINAQITFEANRDNAVQAKLSKIFNMDASRAKSNSAKINSKRIITRSLTNTRKAFNTIYQAHKSEIIDMLSSKECKGTAYMAVALKSFVDAEVEHQKGNENTILIESEIPVIEGVAAAGGIALPLSLDPKLRGERKFVADWIQTHVADGEQVFAIRYRTIKLKKAWFPRTQNSDAEYGEMLKAQWGHGVFGQDKAEEAEDEELMFEDDDSDDEWHEDVVFSNQDPPVHVLKDNTIQA